MQSPVFKLLVIAAFFFATWYILQQVNWMQVFNVEENSKRTEERLGELMFEMLTSTEEEIHKSTVTKPVNAILDEICKANKIKRNRIKLHIIDKDEVNAFALPDDHLVIYSGLIADAEREAELSGVICHELAHITQNHVMKKLVKEIGLSVLVSLTTGGSSGGEVLSEAMRLLSASAYDRSLESEADRIAVDYMTEAGLDPLGLADFLYRMSESTEDIPEEYYWISTHPESEERALEIFEHFGKDKSRSRQVLEPETWKTLKDGIKSN